MIKGLEAKMKMKMNRKIVTFGKAEDVKERDEKYWAKASIKEKLSTITYLMECFYGPEATTGRLQRFYKIFKRT
jgi:hypothetical protein